MRIQGYLSTVFFLITVCGASGSCVEASEYGIGLENESSSSLAADGGLKGPVFRPPGGQKDGIGSDFVCDYSRMPGWRACSEPHDRRCWLTNDCGDRFDINTEYELMAPKGTVRRYSLTVHEGWINADGVNFTLAKLFDNSYPGPWLQACWGDTMEITVHNRLQGNGTSIHWHGVRQWLSMHMDGVNGITQCPIAPGDKFVYRWRVTQYGSSWYHSHYSIQYADGLVGPMLSLAFSDIFLFLLLTISYADPSWANVIPL